MKATYSIGEVEKITGISKDRLRNYDRKSILKPRKEENNQYRQYNMNDIIDILGIEHFRRMDLGLKEIRTIREHGKEGSFLKPVESISQQALFMN